MLEPEHKDQCEAPYCKNHFALVYLGIQVCNQCWKGFCEDADPDLKKYT